MKVILTILFFSFSVYTFSQIRICEKNSAMYSVCYELDSVGNFKYKYSHCTGSVNGIGTFRKTKKSIIFTFDTFTTPRIHKQQAQLKKGIVKISFYHFLSINPDDNAIINYNNNIYISDSSGVVEINYNGGPIAIHQYSKPDSIILNPDKDQSNKYDIFWNYSWETYMPQGTIIRMTKHGKKYKYKEKVLGYSNRKNIYYPRWRTTYYIVTKK